MARVLIVEPDIACRALFEVVLEHMGHEHVAPGELGGAGNLDLLILEPASPDGLAFAEDLRRRLEDLPILCLSILPRGPETERLGAVGHLMKPFGLDDLRSAIDAALR